LVERVHVLSDADRADAEWRRCTPDRRIERIRSSSEQAHKIPPSTLHRIHHTAPTSPPNFYRFGSKIEPDRGTTPRADREKPTAGETVPKRIARPQSVERMDAP
jgi:hypothetical protein